VQFEKLRKRAAGIVGKGKNPGIFRKHEAGSFISYVLAGQAFRKNDFNENCPGRKEREESRGGIDRE